MIYALVIPLYLQCINALPIPIQTQDQTSAMLLLGVFILASIGSVFGLCVCCKRKKRFEEFENESGGVVSNSYTAIIPEPEFRHNNETISPADMENIENNIAAIDFIPIRNEIAAPGCAELPDDLPEPISPSQSAYSMNRKFPENSPWTVPIHHYQIVLNIETDVLQCRSVPVSSLSSPGQSSTCSRSDSETNSFIGYSAVELVDIHIDMDGGEELEEPLLGFPEQSQEIPIALTLTSEMSVLSSNPDVEFVPVCALEVSCNEMKYHQIQGWSNSEVDTFTAHEKENAIDQKNGESLKYVREIADIMAECQQFINNVLDYQTEFEKPQNDLIYTQESEEHNTQESQDEPSIMFLQESSLNTTVLDDGKMNGSQENTPKVSKMRDKSALYLDNSAELNESLDFKENPNIVASTPCHKAAASKPCVKISPIQYDVASPETGTTPPVNATYNADSFTENDGSPVPLDINIVTTPSEPCTSAQALAAAPPANVTFDDSPANNNSGWFVLPQSEVPAADGTFNVEDNIDNDYLNTEDNEENLNLTFDAPRKQLAETDADEMEVGAVGGSCEQPPILPQKEMIIKRPLSPITEESEDESSCKTFVLNKTKCLDSTRTGCLEGVTRTLMASNETLYNFEDTFGDRVDMFSPRIPSTSSQMDHIHSLRSSADLDGM